MTAKTRALIWSSVNTFITAFFGAFSVLISNLDFEHLDKKAIASVMIGALTAGYRAVTKQHFDKLK